MRKIYIIVLSIALPPFMVECVKSDSSHECWEAFKTSKAECKKHASNSTPRDTCMSTAHKNLQDCLEVHIKTSL